MLILSRDNPRIKRFARLKDKRSAREEEGLFVLEGARIVFDALREDAPLCEAFYTKSAIERFPETVRPLIELLGDSAFEISDEVSEKLSATATSQGVFAICSRLDKTEPLDKIVYGKKFVVLDSLQDPGNVGTILRTADAFGADGVFLCDCCDVYGPKTVRSTMGSLFRVPFCDTLSAKEAVEKLKGLGAEVLAAVVDGGAEDIKKISFAERCAVVIGNEGNGLSDETVALCDRRITIKMRGSIESLNAATAAAVLLWELSKR